MVVKMVGPVVHSLPRKIPDPPLYLEFNFEGTMGSVFIKRVSILKSGSYKLLYLFDYKPISAISRDPKL